MKKIIIFFFLLITTIVITGQTKMHYFFIYEYYGNDRNPIVLEDMVGDSIIKIPSSIKKLQKKFIKQYYLYKKSPKVISDNPATQKIFEKNIETLLRIMVDYLPYSAKIMNDKELENDLCYCINKVVLLMKTGAKKSEIHTSSFYDRIDFWWNGLDIILAYYLIQ